MHRVEAGPCPPQDKHPELYAHDETNLTTEELLVALKGDELKEIATKLKVYKPKMTVSVPRACQNPSSS